MHAWPTESVIYIASNYARMSVCSIRERGHHVPFFITLKQGAERVLGPV